MENIDDILQELSIKMIRDDNLNGLSQIEQAKSLEDLKEFLKGLVESRKIMATAIYDLSVEIDKHSTRLIKLEKN